MLNRAHHGDDSGQLTLLIIGFTTFAAILILVGVDASKVFLARRALSSAADAAALAAAQSVDRAAIYSGAGGGCAALPLDPARAAADADRVLADDEADLRRTFFHLDQPQTTVAGTTVIVRLSGDVSLPFAGVMKTLLPGHIGSTAHVVVSSNAQTAVANQPPQNPPASC